MFFAGRDTKVGWPNSILENCWHAHRKQAHKAQKRWIFFKGKLLQTFPSFSYQSEQFFYKMNFISISITRRTIFLCFQNGTVINCSGPDKKHKKEPIENHGKNGKTFEI